MKNNFLISCLIMIMSFLILKQSNQIDVLEIESIYYQSRLMDIENLEYIRFKNEEKDYRDKENLIFIFGGERLRTHRLGISACRIGKSLKIIKAIKGKTVKTRVIHMAPSYPKELLFDRELVAA